jgi:hypothetical protein
LRLQEQDIFKILIILEMEVENTSKWISVGKKIKLIESLYHNVVNNCSYLANIYQGIRKYNSNLDRLLLEYPNLYLPPGYDLIKRPLISVTFDSLHSSNLPQDQWVPVNPHIKIDYYTFQETLLHIDNFLKLMSGGRFFGLSPNLGRFPRGIFGGWNQFISKLDIYINWLEAIISKCNIEYQTLKFSSIEPYWTQLGEKLELIRVLHNKVVNSCRDLKDYNLPSLKLPGDTTIYSFRETMEHINIVLSIIDGKEVDDDILDMLMDFGFLERIFDEPDNPLFIDYDQGIRYESNEILDAYISYLESMINKCHQTMNLVQTAQQNFLARRYLPGGTMSQRGQERNVGIYGMNL